MEQQKKYMGETMKPYFNERKNGGWTFQCPHEPHKPIEIIVIGKGEIVLCFKCAQKVSVDFVKYAEEWK